jgi:beta-glucosidase
VESLSKLERIAKAMDAGVDQFGGETDSGQLVEAVRTGKISEARLDQSVQRILELKFRLGLFENPFVDAARAAGIVGSPSFRQAALGAQRKSLVLLENRRATLPLNPEFKRVFVQGIAETALLRHGLTPVHSAREAQVAILRVAAPHRLLHPGFFFGSRQHEGRLDFEPDTPDLQLINATSRAVPTIVLVSLDRPAILTQFNRKVGALLVDFGVSEDVILDLLLGKYVPEGRLPFELPSSMKAVEAQAADAPHDSAHPLYPIFYGLQRY